MSLSDETLSRLCTLLRIQGDRRITQDCLIELEGILYKETVRNRSACHAVDSLPFIYLSDKARMEIHSKKLAFRDILKFVRVELNKVLRQYCIQHLWEPNYELDIICGVHVESSSSYPQRLYYANFLASGEPAVSAHSLPRERTLFFAEFWELPWHPEQSRSRYTYYPGYDHPAHAPSSPRLSTSCWPVHNYHLCVGHCSYCERASSTIVHPPSGCFSGNEAVGLIVLYHGLLSMNTLDSGVYENLLDSDFIYFDFRRDAELGKVIDSACTRVEEFTGPFNS